jgi:CheY-specific phosphatase CheX
MNREAAMQSVVDTVPLVKEKLRELVRYAALSRMKTHAGCDDVEQVELSDDFLPGQILANNAVFILGSGESVRMTFKVHFNADVAKTLAFRVFGGESASNISIKRAVDYFKEYCNLVIGSAVAIFEQLEIGLGISLPHSTRGFYEVFADYKEQQHPYVICNDFWSLEVSQKIVYCSVVLEILDPKKLEKLIGFEFGETEGGNDEMDFL